MRTCESVSDIRPPAADTPRRLEADNVALLDAVCSGPGRAVALRFDIEQRWVFGLGFGRLGSARAWYRRYDWIQTRRKHGTARALLALLKRPARVVREAWRAAETHGPAVHDAHGTAVWAQRLHMVWLGWRWGLDPESYYRFWLFRRERRRNAGKYIQQHEAGLIYRVLAVREGMREFYITEDKRLFERWCLEQGLPATRTIAEFSDGAIATSDSLMTLPAHDLFSKPVDSFGGAGARRWQYAGRGAWQSPEGEVLDRTALRDALGEQSRRDGVILLQECLENDPRLAPLTSGALTTVRFLTVRPPEGEPELVCAIYRMPTGATSTDNFSLAGIAAPVDLATGQLGDGVKSDPRLVVAPVTVHPDTGAQIAGTCLPWWSEAKALALEAHRRLRAIACVGWDIALTSSGPVLVEANWAPGARLAQAPSGIPLGATNFMRYLDAHMRRSFAREPQRAHSS